MESEGILSISAESVVEEVLKQQGTRLSDIDLASRKAEEAAARRYEATGWLRRTVGVVGSKDLPEQPSEEEFRLGLRNGIVLCNAFNKVQNGAIPKVVEAPSDAVVNADGAALSAYQYFENVRNFLVALEEMGLPTFEACDLERGGKGSRVVDSILALKSYSECKQQGRSSSSKYGGICKPANAGKYFVRRNSEPFMNSLIRSQSVDSGVSMEQNLSLDFSIESAEMTTSPSLNMLVRTILSDKKPEEVPLLVESMLGRVMQEFERRLASQNELVKTTVTDLTGDSRPSFEANVATEVSKTSSETKMDEDEKKEKEEGNYTNLEKDEYRNCTNLEKEEYHMCKKDEETSKSGLLIFDQQQREIQKLEDEETSKSRLVIFYQQQREIQKLKDEETLKSRLLICDQQQREIQELKDAIGTTKAGMEFMKLQHSEDISNLGKHLHVLAHAASGYNRVLEENRKLYNLVQDLKGNIRVYCRVRPFLPGQSSGSTTVARIDDGTITVNTPSKYCKEGHKSFTFNKVFGPSATQEEVFSDTQPLIRSVLDGYNVCIFAYGQTGSGKTFTMTGPKVLTEQSVGVNYRALNDLFYISEQRKDTFYYEIAVQMIEIYNEQVRDLLTNDGQIKRVEICNSSQKGLNVPDANLVPVTSTMDVVELMNLGHKNRAVSATAMNDRSSRSHSCLIIHVKGRDLTCGTVLRGCLNVVDLAGSERVDKSEAKGDRLKEAQHINKSLSALGDVISALAQKNGHVPYRNSKLTQLLQHSLGGQAKTLMFVHISPEVDAIGETLSTLKFAERVATIELGAASSNKENGEVKELKEQIASLKAALAMKEGEPEIARSSMSSPDTYRMKSGYTSPAMSVCTSPAHPSRRPMEDVGNIEVLSNPGPTQKGGNFDIQDVLVETDSSPWPESCPRVQKTDEREMGTGDWIDKIMVNRQEAFITDDDSLKDWEGDSMPVPDFFYQRYMPDVGVFRDQLKNHAESVATDDSDDFEIATSDCSEQDILWQSNIPKISSAVNGGGSRNKKPEPKSMRSPDLRTPSRTPAASRKISNGTGQSGNRTSRIPAPAGTNGRRPVSANK